MPALSGTGANPLLIEIVRKTLEDANEKKDNTYSRIERDTENLGSNKLGVRMPVVVEDNGSGVWRSTDGGDFSQSGAEVYVSLTATHTRGYWAAEFTADIRQMDVNGPTVGPIVAGAIARLNQRVKKEFNQLIFGDGSGEVARYLSGTGTTSIVMTSTTGNFFGATKVLKNKRYQWYDSTLATARNGGLVFIPSSVTRSTKTVVFDSAPTLSANDVLVAEGSVSSVINGFGNLIDNTGSVHGQSRTTYPALNSAVIAAGGAPLTASIMGQIENTMAFKTGMEKIGDGYSYCWSPVQRQAYLDLGYELKQFTNEKAGNLDAGFDGTTFGNIKCMTDVDCPDDTVFCLGLSQFKRFVLDEIGPVTFPGGDIYWPKTASSGQNYADAWIVNLCGKLQVGIPNPRLGGSKVTGLALPGGVSRHIA